MGGVENAALRVLVTVAETESMSEAARRVGTTQQAVSSRMRNLEAQLGVVLVIRSPRGSRLTEAGTVVAAWARDVVDAADRFDEAVRSLAGGATAPLRIASSLTIAEHLMPAWLHRLRADSSVEVELTAANSTVVADRIRTGMAEIGFVETPEPSAGLSSLTVASDELVVVVRPGHRWARRRTVSARELAATPLVMREQGSGTREALERALREHPQALTAVAPAAVLPTTAAVRATVAAGDDPAVLSILAVADAVRAGQLIRVKIADLRVIRPLSAVWSSGASLSPAAEQLLALIARGSSVG